MERTRGAVTSSCHHALTFGPFPGWLLLTRMALSQWTGSLANGAAGSTDEDSGNPVYPIYQGR